MPCSLVRLAWVISLGVATACTRSNPGFGNDAGGSGESSGGGDASASGTATASSSASASTTSSNSGSATAETGDPGGCGNGVVEDDEECDEGAENRDDGACRSDCRRQVCGDGHVGGSELCDPLALAPKQGVDCTPECLPNECHDGYKLGAEKCDDGNMLNDDDCVDECVAARCGDGYLREGEQCEDQNDDRNDACVDCMNARCGDGVVHEGVEPCDYEDPESYECTAHGYSAGEGACTESCVLILYGCTNCGNGVLDEGEACDFQGPLSCMAFGGMGDGTVTCGDQCNLNVDGGECCLPVGAACVADGGDEGACCGACDVDTSLCVEG